jgi:Protein of unknown function (DUF559)
MHPDTALAEIAHSQLGLVTIADIENVGISQSAWSRRVTKALWIPVFPRVYRSAHIQTSPHQRALAALLCAGPKAVLSHQTAAWIHGLDGFVSSNDIHITMPNRRRPTAPTGLVVHVSKRLEPKDRVMVRPLMVTSPARTIIDLAAFAPEYHLENAVDSAVRDRKTSIDTIASRHGTCRGRGSVKLDSVIGELPAGGVHNRLERDYLKLSRLAGLPDPESQAVIRNGGEFVARLDFYYAELRLAIEVSGHRTHSTRNDRAADAKRHRRLSAQGIHWIEFTSDEVFKHPHAVVRELKTLR